MDSLGDRMKNYEHVSKYNLTARVPAIIRIDGKAFHSYTKKIGTVTPYDFGLMDRMNETAKFLCKNIEGSKFAYVQSDEISILITDLDKQDTQAWFDGNIQKISSVSSSLATGFFNSYKNQKPEVLAFFDSRVFNIPDKVEVSNYFKWRFQDWTRNSVQMLARSEFSHKQLHEKSISDMHEMLHEKGINWAKQPQEVKNGRIIIKKNDGWEIAPAPDFMKDKSFFEVNIPSHGYEK